MPEELLLKIYITAFPITWESNGMWGKDVHHDVRWVSVSQDGNIISSGISSSIDWAKNDSGFQSIEKYRNKEYKELFSDGYELVWVDFELAKNHNILSKIFKE